MIRCKLGNNAWKGFDVLGKSWAESKLGRDFTSFLELSGLLAEPFAAYFLLKNRFKPDLGHAKRSNTLARLHNIFPRSRVFEKMQLLHCS
jgi:hypothetical protein